METIKTGITVNDSVAVCACVCNIQKGVDESLTSCFIGVRNELPTRIFLLTYLEDGWMDGGWMIGWKEAKQSREKWGEPTEVLCSGAFLQYLSRQIVGLP